MKIKYHLAQVNIAFAKAEMDTKIMEGFVSRLDEINKVADNAEGFIWRLQSDDGDSTTFRMFKEPLLLVNMSVWKDIKSLKDFVYKTIHVEMIKDRQAWFRKYVDTHQVLWWIPEGYIPTLEDAKEKLDKLQKSGPSVDAFHFGKPFSKPN